MSGYRPPVGSTFRSARDSVAKWTNLKVPQRLIMRLSFLKKIILDQGRSAFSRNFIGLLRANLFGSALAFAALPLLTRLYSPLDFGTLGLLVAVSGILMNVATYRFDWSMPNARTRGVAVGLFAWGFITLGLATTVVVVALVTGLFAVVIVAFESDEQVRESLIRLGFLVPLAVSALGVSELLRGWHVRENDMSSVSRSSVVHKVCDSGLGLLGGLAGMGVAGLLGACVMAFWARAIILTRQTSGLWPAFRRLSPRRMRCILKRFFAEASWSTSVSLVNVSSHTLPLILISSFYSTKDAGIYFLVYRFALAPLLLVTRSLGSTYWAHAAKLYKSGDIRELNTHLILTTRRLAWGAVPITLGCALGPFFVGPMFGEAEWGDAGYMLLALAPVLIAVLIFSPTHHLVALRRPGTQFLADLLRVVLVVASLVVSDLLGWNVFVAVALSSTASFVGYAALFYSHIRVHRQLMD